MAELGAAALELVVQEAASMRDGPTLVARGRRACSGGAGAPVTRAATAIEQLALEALGRAWFFGLALDQPDESADARYLRFVAAHPGCSGAEVQRGLGVRHLSQVNRKLRRLEAEGYLRRGAGPGPANRWWLAGDTA